MVSKKKKNEEECFYAEVNLTSRSAAIEMDIHRTVIWIFLGGALKLFSYKQKILQKIDNVDKIKKRFAYFCGYELRNDSNFQKWNFSFEWEQFFAAEKKAQDEL